MRAILFSLLLISAGVTLAACDDPKWNEYLEVFRKGQTIILKEFGLPLDVLADPGLDVGFFELRRRQRPAVLAQLV